MTMEKIVHSFSELESFLNYVPVSEEVVHMTTILKSQLLIDRAEKLYEEHVMALLSNNMYACYIAVQTEGSIVEKMLRKFSYREAYEEMYAPYKWVVTTVNMELKSMYELKNTCGYTHIGNGIYAKGTAEDVAGYRAFIENRKVIIKKKTVDSKLPAMRIQLHNWMLWAGKRMLEGTWREPKNNGKSLYPRTYKIRTLQ